MSHFDASWWKVLRLHGMCTEDDWTYHWYMKIWRMVSRMHWEFTEVDWKSQGCTESWLNVPLMYEKLTQDDGSPADVSWWKFTEGPADIRTFDGRSHGWTECGFMVPRINKVDGTWQKVLRMHGKLMEVYEWSAVAWKGDGRSRWHTES